MDKVIAIVFLVILALIFLLIARYMRLDRKRFVAVMCYNAKVDDHVIDWLQKLLELIGTLEADEALLTELDGLIDRYDALPDHKAAEKVPIVNRIHALFERLRRERADSEAFAGTVVPLNRMFADFTVCFDEYNQLAGKYNEGLQSGVGKAVAALFRLKPLERLDGLEL